MIKQQIKKFNSSKVDSILAALELAEDAAELRSLGSDLAILRYLETQKLYSEAVKFLAYGLPKREAIWWAYLASTALEKDHSDPQTQEALTVIKNWTRKPDEALRRHAGKIGAELQFYTPTSWTATAILWSGGSITPEGRPIVEASEDMCAKAVSNAIIISAHQLSRDPNTAFVQFLRQGLHIGMGGNGCIDPT